MSAPKADGPAAEAAELAADKRNKRWVVLLLASCALLCLLAVIAVVARQKPAGEGYATAKLQAGGKTYDLQVADTPAKNELGLGKRENLGARAGMLFTYAEERPAEGICFWMKDMRFSIDIIWLDSQKRITHIEPSLSPATYPNTYCPPKASQYVVELNAGTAQKLGWQTGQSVDIAY